MPSQFARPLWPLLLLLAVCSWADAQEDKKSAFVTIKVTDVSGAVLRNAEVHFVEHLSRAEKVQAIDGTGNARFELAPGDYELSVTSPGFKSLVMRDVEVKPGEHRQFDIVLKVQDCPPGSCGDVEPPAYEPERARLKSLEIKGVKLFAWQVIDKKRKYVEVQTFLETKELHLFPADKFDVVCEVVGGSDVLAGDYFLWTTVDFLVARVTRAFDQMDNSQLGSSAGWGQVMEMRDLKVTPIYFLRPNEAREVAVKDLDLGPVLASFPVGDAAELWPWLVRVTIHVLDRSGKQIAVAERTLRLSPSSARKISHYDDPLPSR
jgi:hypothetical protein